MSGQGTALLPPLVVIVGPTAVGKSRLALDLARRFQVDIVSADSRQVYRYMDIGTAKPSTADRDAVAHFMLDLVAPDQTYSAHLYREEGLAVLRRIGRSGRAAFVVGGTGFYVRSLLDGLVLPPVPPNPNLRRELRDAAQKQGVAALHERLSKVDPTSAGRIHPNNLSRVIRALEVVSELEGPVPSAGKSTSIPALYLGLSSETQTLRERVNKRVRDQVAAGLVAETRSLLEMGYSPDLPSVQGLGYREMMNHLAGNLSLDEAIAEYQAATRQYARRQMTWFRADSRIHWIDAEQDPADKASALIASHFSRASSQSV